MGCGADAVRHYARRFPPRNRRLALTTARTTARRGKKSTDEAKRRVVKLLTEMEYTMSSNAIIFMSLSGVLTDCFVFSGPQKTKGGAEARLADVQEHLVPFINILILVSLVKLLQFS
jgi:hypothetical protein